MPSIAQILSGAVGADPFAPELQSIVGDLPWASVGNPTIGPPDPNAQPLVNSPFFHYLSPKGELWDKLVPYRLLVIDTRNGNKVVGGNNPSEVSIVPLGNGTIDFIPLSNAWEFFLPITPQQLSITDPFAINVSATLRGILEEHSGVRFKNITVQGTFGVWPGRPSITSAPSTPGILQSVFGGTITAAQNVATQFQSVINAATTGALASKPTTVRPGDLPSGASNLGDSEQGLGTGYYQTIMLQQFLEQYAEAKRNPNNAGWRLIFDIPKQNQSFVVTPVAFTWNENVNRPMEINYNLQFKAWRRINLQDRIITQATTVTPLSPGILQQILNTVSAAQNTAAASYALIGSVRSDVNNILNIIRQTGIFVKQLAGVALAANDLPVALLSDLKGTISQFLQTLNINNLIGPAATDKNTIAALLGIQGQSQQNEGTQQSDLGQAIAALATANADAAAAQLRLAQSNAIAAINSMPGNPGATRAFSSIELLIAIQSAPSSALARGNSDIAALIAAQTAAAQAINNVTLSSLGFPSPSNIVFTQPSQYPLLFGQVPVNSLSLNSSQQLALNTELDNVSDFTVAQLKTMRATILTLATQLSNSFGAGDAYYSTLFNLPPPTVRDEPMTIDEFNILQQFYELVQAYDVLTATNQLDNDQILNSMEYVQALAATSDIELNISNSKIQVPVPYGLNVEQIAMRYLGDPQRWLEIVTLNELREPYIDQNGFQYSLLSNASGRSIVINGNQDLFIGQTIFLNSNTQPATARTIINMQTLTQNSFLITLDGLANLDAFTTVDQAYIQAYLPGTVNSQNVIWIPSNLVAPAYDQINIPASVANVNLVGLSKVDWQINTLTGDLVINNTGDFQLSAGINNIVQALAIKFNTQLGTCLLNPDFGFGVKPGTMVSDTSAADIYNNINKLVTSDPRFSGISGLQVNITPPSLNISLGIGLAGIQGLFPVSFQLPTSH